MNTAAHLPVSAGPPPPQHRSHQPPPPPPPPSVVADAAEAQDFLLQFYREHPDQPVPFSERLREVRNAIETTGSYWHTAEELTYGARVAWRNSSRCIGRLYWRSLRVLDRRDAYTPDAVHHQLVNHLRAASNNGRIRPVISVFPPLSPATGGVAPAVWNSQLIRYAGYRQPDGGVVGDPAHTDFTEAVLRMGWRPPGGGGPFDLLPLVIDCPGHGPVLRELDRADVLEVALHHPTHPAVGDLGLRWHAVPAISHMRLRVGGVDYPLAPFNGWYMGTEIAARNLTDTDRYNLLPVLAERFGLDTSSELTLWRDRTLVELNVAVLHSFTSAGVKITDHHTESRHFLTHLEREEAAGRRVPVDWSWIVPPVSGGITPVFHRYYDEGDQRPNFYLDTAARRRSEVGDLPAGGPGGQGGGCPVQH